MSKIQLSQHIYTSVTKGTLYPNRKGFQTVALTDDLIGSQELMELEMASFYSISAQRLKEKDFPVKETFFRLSSGRMAVGRSVYSPPDDTGREGNFLTHHLIIEEKDFKKIGGNPIYALDRLKKIMSRNEYTVGELPNVHFSIEPEQTQLLDFPEAPRVMIHALYALILNQSRPQKPLLIGKPSGVRELLRAIYPTLPMEERYRLTFDTHFFESEHLQEKFSLVAVEYESESPRGAGFFPLSIESRSITGYSSYATAYSRWLADCALSQKWQDIESMNALLESNGKYNGELPEYREAIAALWERGKSKAIPLLLGKPELIAHYFDYVTNQKELADTLLSYRPSEIMGDTFYSAQTVRCLNRIIQHATLWKWKEWAERWKNDPIVIPHLPEKPQKSRFLRW